MRTNFFLLLARVCLLSLKYRNSLVWCCSFLFNIFRFAGGKDLFHTQLWTISQSACVAVSLKCGSKMSRSRGDIVLILKNRGRSCFNVALEAYIFSGIDEQLVTSVAMVCTYLNTVSRFTIHSHSTVRWQNVCPNTEMVRTGLGQVKQEIAVTLVLGGMIVSRQHPLGVARRKLFCKIHDG